VISEAHSILAHLGLRKTLDYLRDHFWWKEMVEDTRSFCESCSTCRRSTSMGTLTSAHYRVLC
jgi:hypothetical protein